MDTEIGGSEGTARSTFRVISRATNSRWFLGSASLGIFLFTVVRGMAAWPLSMYGMQIWIFILIDFVTAFPYVWGINNIVRGIRTREAWKLLADGAVVVVSFMAPYLYLFLSAGSAMPLWVVLSAVMIIIVLALVGPIRKILGAWKHVR